jgi:DNA-binding response OmpR family regulator
MSMPTADLPAAESTAGRILITDDDPSSRGGLVAILEHAGFDCRTAGSSTEALGLLATETFDLIIADIHMEGNSQLELVATVNRREEAPPLILVTGQPSIETATQAVRLRVFDYVLKPVDGEQLVALAREGVASSRMMKLLRSHRHRLKESLAEIDRCENLSRNATGTALNAALGTYLSVAVQQSLSTIGDIGDLAAAIVARDETGEAQRRMQTARPLVLVDAVRETIQVLERTKTSFKSRELAELRRKLEELVGAGREK